MRIKNSINSYNETTAQKYISDNSPIISISSEIEVQYNWIEKKRTDEITGYKLYFVQEGVSPFSVKFTKKPVLPPFLSEIKLNKLEAIEIKNSVYFRASEIEGIK